MLTTNVRNDTVQKQSYMYMYMYIYMYFGIHGA
jgi:hypothetical protein